MYSATAFDTSLAERSKMPYKACSSVICSPSCMAICALFGSILYTASWEKVMVSSKFPFSNAKSTVISFVILAGYILFLLFFSYSISPVVASIRIAASADIWG